MEKLTKDLDNYRRSWRKAYEKVSGYENLAESAAEIKFYHDNSLKKLSVSGEQLIREYAPVLIHGILKEGIESGLISIISHSWELPEGQIKVTPQAIETVALFFEVFEIATKDDSGVLVLNANKKYLLKAAFRPLAQVISDEIPF